MIDTGDVQRLDSRRKQWLHLTPDLVEALEQLAKIEGISLEALLISLVNEALAHRLHRRSG
jgi:hypothetical protein